MKVTINHYHAVAVWKWNLNPANSNQPTLDRDGGDGQGGEDDQEQEEEEDDDDDVCGICRVAFDGCCPDCKVPGDACPPIWGECTHVFHMHCLMKWLATESSKQQCPMDRRAWVTAGSPHVPVVPERLAAQPIPAQAEVAPPPLVAMAV